MADSRQQFWKYSLIVIIIVLGGIIFRESLPFLSGILGACTVYMLVRTQMFYLTEKKKIKGSIAAIILLVEVCLCFLVPAFFALWLLANRVSNINLQPTIIFESVQHINSLVREEIDYDLLSQENISAITALLTSFAQKLLNQITMFVINCVVLLFVLYFMLIGCRRMEAYIYDILPFKPENKKEVVNSTKVMIRSNAIGIPLLAIIQGFIAMIGYIIFGTPDPVLFAFLTCFSTILPLVGTALIWLPLSIYLFSTGDQINGIGLVLYGIIVVSNIDNVIRFILQKKLADTHPMITIFGVVIGLTLFGFLGVIFGPLLLSIFLLCFDLYKREYIDKENRQNIIMQRQDTSGRGRK